jgi:hypothetical protein
MSRSKNNSGPNARNPKQHRGNSFIKGKNKYTVNAKNRKDEAFKDQDMNSETNDPGWYTVLSPQLIEDAAHVNFSWPAGMVIPNLTLDEGFLNANLCALHSIPTINYPAARTAMWSMYSAMRQVNSGAKNYTPEDLFACLINGCQAYSALNWAIRFYTMSTMFNGNNRAVPHAFFEAEGADLDSFINNRADYRMMLNAWILKFGTVAMPNFMPIFAREAFLYQNIYTEGTSWRDQLYMFVPDMFWTVSLDTTAGHVVKSTVVKTHPVDGERITPTVVDSILNTIYQNIVVSESFNIISGDIAKMYPNNLIMVSEVGPDLTIQPIFDLTVLEQIKNARVYNVNITSNTFQYSGTDFMYSPEATLATYDQFMNSYKDVITTSKDDVSAVDIVELTRLIPYFDENGSYITSGSDMIRQVDFIAWNGALQTARVQKLLHQAYFVASATYTPMLSSLTQFKYLPAFGIVRGNDASFVFDGYVHNLDNFGIMDRTDLSAIHYAALLNLYYVPVKGVTK